MTVNKSLADSLKGEVHGPKKKITLLKVGELARISDRMIISCKCKGKCATKNAVALRKERSAQFTTIILLIIIVAFSLE
jgi:hypothetical protein